MIRPHVLGAMALLALAICAGARAAPALDEYGGWPEIWGAKTGFFGLEKIRDRWWFTTPAGNVFLAKGVAVVNPPGGEAAEGARRRLLGWGFNAVGPDCPEALQSADAAYTVLLNLSGPTIDAGATPPGVRFPDVFDPRFERIANEIAANICSLHVDNPWLLGYFTDDALEWRGEGPGNLADVFFAMAPESAAKQALVAELRKLCGDNVERFNADWGLALGSLDDLLPMRELKPGPRFQGYAVSRDRARLRALIAERYFEVTSAAIKAHDPKHVVLGCRFAVAPGPEVLAAMRGRADVMSIAGRDLTPDLLTQLHADCGLPMLVSPLAISPAVGEKQVAQQSRGDALGIAYRSRLEELEKAAFVVGFEWPRYADEAGAPGDSPGLVDAAGDVDADLTARVEKANDRFYAQAALARLKPTLFEIVDRYELRRAGTAGIAVDGNLKDWASAMPMELRPSAYEEDAGDIAATAYLMWDSGALYVAGRLSDPAVEASSATSFVGADWIELTAAVYSFYVTLMPGNQTVTDVNRNRTREASLVVGRLYTDSEAGAEGGERQLIGYTFEGQVNISGMIPEGFVSRFGLALHHYTAGGREVKLSFPSYWSPANPASRADIIIAGRAEQ